MLRTVLAKYIPATLRRKLGLFRDKTVASVYEFPVIGPLQMARKISHLEKTPQQINIEITSICNARCIMCPRENMDRDMKVMDQVLYEKIIFQAKNLGVKKFALNGYGEIFSAKKHYAYFIDHLLKEIPDARIIINTNGSLMNERVSQFLIDRGVDTVHIDIDGATPETYEKIRINLRYKTVVENVRRLIDLRKKQSKAFPKVRVGIIGQPENEHEIELFLRTWRGVADFVADHFLVNRGGDVETHHEHSTDNPCYLLWSEMNIWSDGSVAICCDDWNGKESMGNINETALEDIWQGASFSNARDSHKRGCGDEVGICSKCSFSRPGPDWFFPQFKKSA